MISKEENTRISKTLSYVLRHNPGHIGLELDEQGWGSVDTLCRKLELSPEVLKHIVDTNAKSRFNFNHDGTMVRASQGHSIEVDLQYTPQTPPAVLFHGTAEKNIPGIEESGLQKMNRHHVHLSKDRETALAVGTRHGKPVVLVVDAQRMHQDGHVFFLSDNGVWLTERVPVAYIAPLI
ncbi:RNA 2'-phosphotransferase [Dinghuibacter silviterrae]|uniref:Probable RNA 2'-phosphotransferase n=1 Tax=Dinghuibacter silviterrae TaxID=1539049 RepID=A0A4R8DNU6_9BACT|nr:RNA 2'-phosphotransferase [Dinghuibacter silviterrae]TDW99749.1 putative RNA 2'-phosphotransferase [Dinghuibacter silviterrae]